MEKPTTIYRIENEVTKHGMWYDASGNYNPFIKRLTDGKSKDLPMDFDERYGEGGVRWYSGCGDVEMLKHWFSEQDARELSVNGYKLYVLESKQTKEEELQTLFTREGIVSKRAISLDEVWGF